MHATWRLSEGDEIVPGLEALELLGGGTRYEAYLAWDEHLHAIVVAKMLRPDQVSDQRALAQIRAEARLLGSLAHPLLMRCFGAMLDGDRPHLVLEHIEGPRLSTLIRRHGLAMEQVLPLGLDLVRLLRYFEAEDVLHLDVKPRNIIMAGRPRLIDLSVAQHRHAVLGLTTPVGTEAYMAPEQCDVSRFGELSSATDVFGVGATLYEALSGKRPFTPDGERFPQLRSGPAPLPKQVPAPLADMVMRALSLAPAGRPSLGEIGDLLEGAVDRLPQPRISRFRPGGAARLRGLA